MYQYMHSVHPPFLPGGGVESPTKFSKTGGGGLDRTLIFRGGWWERRGELFDGGSCNFYILYKPKSEILMTKKVDKQKLTKN